MTPKILQQLILVAKIQVFSFFLGYAVKKSNNFLDQDHRGEHLLRCTPVLELAHQKHTHINI